jgi:hypothetical protein
MNLCACKQIIKEANDVPPKYTTMRPPTPTKRSSIGFYQSSPWVTKAIDEWCALAPAMNHLEVIIQSLPEDWKETITRLKSLNAKRMAAMIFDTFHGKSF